MLWSPTKLTFLWKGEQNTFFQERGRVNLAAKDVWEESHLVEWNVQSKHSGKFCGPNFFSESACNLGGEGLKFLEVPSEVSAPW